MNGTSGRPASWARSLAGPLLAVATGFACAAACSGAASTRTDGPGLTPGTVAPAAFDLAALAPAGLEPLGTVERHEAATLYEKIDGKANVYFAAGFSSLQCRRFRDSGSADAGVELCVYRMRDPMAAFAVLGEQRPPDARPLDLVPDACDADTLTLLALGRDFVEITDGPGARDAEVRNRLARAFVESSSEPPWDRPRLPFPERGRLPNGLRLQRSSAFGFQPLTDVFEARYRLDGAEATAFWSARSSAAEAAELALAYVQHLLASGATRLTVDVGLPGAVVLDVYGTVEVIAVLGSALAGVHQADTLAAARALATDLARTYAAGETAPGVR